MQSISTLPADVQQKLNALKAISPESLTSEQLDFLRARRSYLTPDEQIRLGLIEAPKATAAAEAPVGVAKASRKTAKTV